MKLPALRPTPVALLAILSLLSFPGGAHAQAVIEGHVKLPPSHSAPVLNQRYQIVSKAGELSTNPPLAVVYLAGAFEMFQRVLEFAHVI